MGTYKAQSVDRRQRTYDAVDLRIQSAIIKKETHSK